MPALKNQRHELFVQGYAGGLPAYKAYLQAGYVCTTGAAMAESSRLLRNHKVQERLREASAEVAKNLNIGPEAIAMMLLQDRQLAHDTKQPGAAHGASMSLAKLLGHITDKSETTINHNYALMTEEEVLFEIASLHQEVRASSKGKH